MTDKKFIKLIFIFILFLVFLTNCSIKKEIINTQPYSKECCITNNKDEIIRVEYYSENNSLKSLFFVDFESKQSIYIEKDEKGNTICKGSFDINSYDTTTKYTETIWLQEVHRDGTFGSYEQSFNFMKSGIWSYYYTNGILQMKGLYKLGKRDGIWNFYSPTSDLEIIRTYQMGEVFKDSIISNELYITPPK